MIERIGHRGAKRECPENTLPAFRRAFERGAHAVELDVHATRDGVVVVHHDPAVPGGDSAMHPIATTAWAELPSLELAPGATIPTLAQVLDEAAGRTVYVEIKGNAIETLVATVIRGAKADCAVHSFDHAAIERMRAVAPEIPRGILFEDGIDRLQVALDRTQARDVWPHWRLIDRSLVDTVHSAGGRVIAWTVNDRAVAERLATLGVDGLCGDDVRLFHGL